MRLHLFFILFLGINLIGFCQFTPYFENYDISQYRAGNQNWDISEAEDGRLYVANNQGLLQYDGLNWQLYQMPNKTTIRSVLAHNNKIYVGSYEEFGYFENSGNGTLVYKSISRSSDVSGLDNQEFWQILAFGDQVVFRSFTGVYIYNNNKNIKQFTPPSTLIHCKVLNNELHVATLNNGIFKLKNDKLIPYISDERLNNCKVVDIVDTEEGLFIVTALNGCFIFNGKELKIWNKKIELELKKYQVNTFSELKNGSMAFGTIQNGIYVIDSLAQEKYHINRDNGLINNTVLSQYLSEKGKLWLGLDNGLTSINLNNPLLFYNDITGQLGAVYDVVKFNDKIYIGSNTGLHVLDQNKQLKFIAGSQGQVWNLRIVEGDLFCGHNNGTFIVENDEFKMISSQTGGWDLKKVPESNGTYVQATYAGLVKYQKNQNNWTFKHLGKTTMPIRFLAFEDKHTAWAAHAYKGLYRVSFNKELDSIVNIKNYKDKGLGSTYNIRVNRIKNDICIKTNEGWHKYEPLLDSIVPFDLMNKNFGKESYLISDANSDVIALKKSDKIMLLNFADSGNDVYLKSKDINERLILGYENFSRLYTDTFAINLTDGFLVLNLNNQHPNYNIYPPSIESVYLNGDLVNINSSNAYVVPYRYQDLIVNLSSPKSTDYYFEYSVNSIDSSRWFVVEKGKLDLSNMGYGDYDFSVRTKDVYGDTSEPISFEVVVNPPWYKSSKGFLVYAIFIALLGVLIYVLHRRKINKEQSLLALKFEEERKQTIAEKTIENERNLTKVKTSSLKNELELKSKQLANTAMALVKKNETLLELKNELLMHKSAFDNYYAYKKLMKKIDNSIGHDDEWAIFENNFNQVHQEFLNKLEKQHPELTPKDLKVCAYIKMDLSSKEIAPLLNISVRGVETQRYRLKQKLNLESDTSLLEYVRSFK